MSSIELLNRLEFQSGIHKAEFYWRTVQRPAAPLDLLQLGDVGRQIDEPDAFGRRERLGVPANAVEHENDDAVAAGAGLARAKSARIRSNSSLSTPVERDQKLSLVAGETKVVT